MFIKPEISVILSTYARNHGYLECPNLLKRSIDSILAQEFIDFELLIFDDGSTDGTKEVLREYSLEDPRVKVFRSEINSARPAIRYNEGIAKAQGQYIAFMFDDDLWYPSALKALHKSISCAKFFTGMVYGQIKYFDVAEKVILEEKFGQVWDARKIKRGNFLANNSVLIKREVFDVIGGYDESAVMGRLCDHELWQRLSTLYSANLIPEVIGEVHGFLPGSIGVTVPFKEMDVKAHLRKRKSLPLKKKWTIFTFMKMSVNKMALLLKRLKKFILFRQF